MKESRYRGHIPPGYIHFNHHSSCLLFPHVCSNPRSPPPPLAPMPQPADRLPAQPTQNLKVSPFGRASQVASRVGEIVSQALPSRRRERRKTNRLPHAGHICNGDRFLSVAPWWPEVPPSPRQWSLAGHVYPVRGHFTPIDRESGLGSSLGSLTNPCAFDNVVAYGHSSLRVCLLLACHNV